MEQSWLESPQLVLSFVADAAEKRRATSSIIAVVMTAASLVRFFFGRRTDWHLTAPRIPRLHLHRGTIGPLIVTVTSILGWPAFSGATGQGNVGLGLWVGSVAIMLMSWSFILAVRVKFLEGWFDGLDSMYRVHRWAGALSLVFMWLHTSIEPEIRAESVEPLVPSRTPLRT